MGCGIGKEPIGWYLMWMAHARQPVNELCHPPLIYQLPSAGWMRCVLQATWGASGEKLLEP